MNSFLSKLKRTRFGLAAFAAAVILLLALIVVNYLLVPLIPRRFSAVNTGGDPMLRLSDKTRAFVKALDEPVTVYHLLDYDAETTSLDINENQLALFLSRYADISDFVRLEEVDIAEQPDFASQYTAQTLPHNSLIVESGRRSYCISADKLCKYNNDVLDQLLGQASLLSAKELLYYMNQLASVEGGTEYLANSVTTGYFLGDSLVTAAMDYVTAEVIPHGYLVTGLDNRPLPDRLTEELAGIGCVSADMADWHEVPADADCLILYAPTVDMTDAQTAMMRAYLDRGGALVLFTAPSAVESCPNIMSLGQPFGLTALPGNVCENDASYHLAGNPQVLYPVYNSSNRVGYMVGYSLGLSALMPYSHAIGIAPVLPEGAAAQPVLTTSPAGVRKSAATAAALDVPGVLNVGVYGQRQVTGRDGKPAVSRMFWYGSTEAFTEDMAAAASYSSYYYFIFSVNACSTGFSSEFSQLDPVEMSGSSLTGLTAKTAVGWMVVVSIVVPVLTAAAGVSVYLVSKRRRARNQS